MKTKFVGWALAHRPDLVGQSPTLQGLTSRGLSSAIVLLSLLIVLVFFLVLPKILHRTHVPDVRAKQWAQLRTIDTVLELFKADFGYYPPSEALDKEGKPYCGAMKLCEAAMGQDLMGVHPKSVFRSDGTDSDGNVLYPPPPYGDYDTRNLEKRKGPYLTLDTANPHSLADLYGQDNTGPFDPNHLVMCDEFKHVNLRGTLKTVGMPILYYKADTSKTAHDVNDPNNPENIYDYRDNQALLALGVPGKPGQKHPLFENPKIFYEMTRDYKSTKVGRPVRADTHILLSAGKDGLYGTKDDIPNFAMQWKPK